MTLQWARWRLVSIGLVLLAALAGDRVAAQSATSADIKAAFLFNFAKFVEWPASDPDPQSVVIGVLGNDAIADSLSEMVKGKALQGGRRLSARKLSRKDDPATVHILFIGASESALIPEVMKRLGYGTRNVLTVSDADRFCVLGGIIQFRAEADRIRFDIHLQNAQTAGLTINSKLLSLAGAVHSSKSP